MFCTEECKTETAEITGIMLDPTKVCSDTLRAEARDRDRLHAAVPVYTPEPRLTDADLAAWGQAHNAINRARDGHGLSVCDTCAAPSNRPAGLNCLQLESFVPPRLCAGRLVKQERTDADDT